MVKKKEVVICDKCNEKIAKYKCDLCEIDLCSEYNCSKEINLEVKKRVGTENPISFNRIYFCSDCEEKVFELLKETPNEILDKENKIKDIIIERVKKNLMLNGLKHRKKKDG